MYAVSCLDHGRVPGGHHGVCVGGWGVGPTTKNAARGSGGEARLSAHAPPPPPPTPPPTAWPAKVH